MTEKTLVSPRPSEIPIADNFKKVFRQYGSILDGAMALITLPSFINDGFLTANSITNITLQVSIVTATAYGITYVLLLGDIDLPVGSAIVLTGTFTAFRASQGVPFVLLTPLSIIATLALGMINGGLTAITGVPPSAITVATMGIFRSIDYIMTDGMPIMVRGDASLAPENGELLYIPIPIWILIILLLISRFILTKTAFGREVYITGGNEKAAVYSGISATRLKIKVLMVTVVLADISRIILASRLYSGQLNSALSCKLDAIAAAVLGDAGLSDGYETMVGTVISALAIGVIDSGMNLMSTPYFYQMVVKGLVIPVAVYFGVRNKGERS